MPTLILVRHAKAEPHRPGDLTRALAARGRTDAAALGSWLRQAVAPPNRAVVSPSVRTRETWELAAVDCPDVVLDERVYEATSGELREVIGQTPSDVDVLLLVGHNPALEQLSAELDPTGSLVGGLATCAAAVFTVSDWSLPDSRLRQWWSPRSGAGPSASP